MTDTELPIEPLVNSEQAAQILAVTTMVLDALRMSGKGPTFVKVGRGVRYAPSALAEYIATNSRTKTGGEV